MCVVISVITLFVLFVIVLFFFVRFRLFACFRNNTYCWAEHIRTCIYDQPVCKTTMTFHSIEKRQQSEETFRWNVFLFKCHSILYTVCNLTSDWFNFTSNKIWNNFRLWNVFNTNKICTRGSLNNFLLYWKTL